LIPDPRALTTDEHSYQAPSLQPRHGRTPVMAATPVMAPTPVMAGLDPAIPMRMVADWHCIFRKVEDGRVESGGCDVVASTAQIPLARL
jgi:hypothetical protein